MCKIYHTLRLAIPGIEDCPFEAIVVDDAATNCVPLAVGAPIVFQRLVPVSVETTIVAMIGEAGGCGVVPAWHTIKTCRLR